MKKTMLSLCFFAFILCSSSLPSASSFPETNPVKRKDLYSFDVKNPFGSTKKIDSYNIYLYNLCYTDMTVTSLTVGGIEVTSSPNLPLTLCGVGVNCVADNPGPEVIVTVEIIPNDAYSPKIYYTDLVGNWGWIDVNASGTYAIPVTLTTSATTSIYLVRFDK